MSGYSAWYRLCVEATKRNLNLPHLHGKIGLHLYSTKMYVPLHVFPIPYREGCEDALLLHLV